MRPERRAQRVAELRQIFTEVAAAYPDGQSVRGASWLYHVRAYRDLFPPAFISGLRSIRHLHQFAALWGQFIDRHGVVKAHLRKPFMEKIAEAQTLGDLNSAFPRDVLATISPIEGFYRHFQVDAP